MVTIVVGWTVDWNPDHAAVLPVKSTAAELRALFNNHVVVSAGIAMAADEYFVIADITGYTAFLSQTALDHAEGILKTLFDTLLETLRPPLVVSNFQGDAILSHASEGSFI